MGPDQCHIQQFFWSASFWTSVARRKAVKQLGSLRGAINLPQWGPEAKPQKTLVILHSE